MQFWVDANAKLVTYNSNYPSGADTSVTQPADGTFSIKSVEDTGFAVAGYKFTGWNRAKDGTSTIMKVGGSYNIDSDRTLFAQWRPYKITYDMNGGSDDKEFSEEIDNKTLGSGTITAKIPSQKYDYYTFLGWSTSPNAASATYTKGVSISLSDDTTLYAVWKLGTIVEDKAVSVSSSTTQTTLSFTLLDDELVYLKMVSSDALYFYLYNSSSSLVYSSGKLNGSTDTKTKLLSADTYTLKIENKNFFSAHEGAVTLKSAGVPFFVLRISLCVLFSSVRNL